MRARHCTGNAGRLKRLLWRDGEVWRDGEGWQERVSVRLVEGEGFCCSLYKQPLMNIKIVNGSLLKLELLALTPSNNLDVAVHATSVLSQ